jgi:hypothetical protein
LLHKLLQLLLAELLLGSFLLSVVLVCVCSW